MKKLEKWIRKKNYYVADLRKSDGAIYQEFAKALRILRAAVEALESTTTDMECGCKLNFCKLCNFLSTIEQEIGGEL